MSYVVAGYVIVLSVLFLYGCQLVWRRRRLERTVERVMAFEHARTVAGEVEPAGAGGPPSLDGPGHAERGHPE